MIRKLIALGFVVLLAACGDAATEPAADLEPQFGAKGANVWKDGGHEVGCSSWPGVLEYCWDYHYTVNQVTTPSGNDKYSYHAQGAQTEVWFGEGTYTYDFNYHYNWLIKNGELHVYSWNDKQTLEYPSGETCAYTWQYHFANGKVTREVEDVECI